MGLVLVSLVLAGTLPAAAGPDPASRTAAASQSWTDGAGDSRLSSTPPQATGSAREHHVLWLALRVPRSDRAAHLRLLPAPDLDPGAIRDPQQLAHRTAGSRSPPLI